MYSVVLPVIQIIAGTAVVIVGTYIVARIGSWAYFRSRYEFVCRIKNLYEGVV